MIPEWLIKIQKESDATEQIPLFKDDEIDVLVAGYTCTKALFGEEVAYQDIRRDLFDRYEQIKQEYIRKNQQLLTPLWISFLDGIHLAYERNTKSFTVAGKAFVPDYYLPDLDCYFKLDGTDKITEYYSPEFVRGVDGFSLLVSFGEPHEMTALLFSEYGNEDSVRKGCTKAFFAGKSTQRTVSGLYIHGKFNNEFYRSINRIGYTKDGEFCSLPAAATLFMGSYTQYHTTNILKTYSNENLRIPIREHYYLHSDFRDKDLIKELGARWDPDVEMWYVDSQVAHRRCCEELKAVEEQREQEHKERRERGFMLLKLGLETAGYENLETQKEKDSVIDRLWKEIRGEYKFTKKEIKQFATECYDSERE